MNLYNLLKKNKKEKSLANVVGDNLVSNSQIVKKSLATTKIAIVPLSKIIDYSAVAFGSILLYVFFTNNIFYKYYY